MFYCILFASFCFVCLTGVCFVLFFFFFNDTATTEIYTLSLHDALPISPHRRRSSRDRDGADGGPGRLDRKSTRLNSSHHSISYAVFCLKKKRLGQLTTAEVPPGSPHDKWMSKKVGVAG